MNDSMFHIDIETYPDKLTKKGKGMTVQELHGILWLGIRSGEIQGTLPSSAEMKRNFGTGHNKVHQAIGRLNMQEQVCRRQKKRPRSRKTLPNIKTL